METDTAFDELIQKARDGDQEAFGEIFEHFITPIYRFAFFRVADQQNAEKLTEEIFLKTWKNLRKFHAHGKMSFTVWIFQMSHTETTRFLERFKKMSTARKKFLEEKEEEDIDEAGTDEREQQALAQAFIALPNMQAESIILKYFCNLSTAEIGLILEKTEGAVRILQSRGLKRLRELVEG